MTLTERLQQEMKQAMIARDATRLGTIRLIKSAIGYLQIEKKTESLPDSEVIALLQREVKKRREAMEQFTKAGRMELVEKEAAELKVIEEFLPKALSDSELEALVRQSISKVGATSKKQMGEVIKAVQAEAAGSAEGRRISEWVGKLLA